MYVFFSYIINISLGILFAFFISGLLFVFLKLYLLDRGGQIKTVHRRPNDNCTRVKCLEPDAEVTKPGAQQFKSHGRGSNNFISKCTIYHFPRKQINN